MYLYVLETKLFLEERLKCFWIFSNPHENENKQSSL
jgi:hypothetical protein